MQSRRAVIATHILLLAMVSSATAAEVAKLHPPLERYVADRVAEFDQIPLKRRGQLDEVAAFVQARRAADAPVLLNFVCTHNSRRSQMAQLWAAAAAAHFGIDGVETFSGGTERKAFNPRAIAALKRAGFEVEPIALGESTVLGDANPRYHARYSPDGPSVECFSKVYSEPPNPSADFCAIMVCAQADEACPDVTGASLRIAIPYEDPKAADDTPAEAATYDERCAQIAREMLFVFSRVEASR